jgi:AcrR family transcriptional regulator
VDGRSARRDRNREDVLDAVLSLFAEGHLVPSAPMVAERAGVSLRSVFRYYEDTDALIRAALARHLEVLAPLFEIPDLGEGPFEERLDRYVGCRLRLYQAVAPMARASLLRAPTSPIIAEQLDHARRRGLEQLAAMFAPELDALPAAERQPVLDAADALCQFETMEHLTEHRRLGGVKAAAALRHGLHRLLDTSASVEGAASQA